MKKVLVTGATGLIGSHMTSFLKDKGYYVIAIGRKNNKLTKEWYEKADKVYFKDLIKISLESFLPNDLDLIYHFAADMGGVGYFSKYQYEPFVNNIQMDIKVFEFCRKNKIRLFYPSSICAYPIHLQTNKGLTEDTLIPANPNEMYGWEKLMAMLLSQHAPFETRVGVLHTIFGPGQEYEGERAKFPPQITHKVIISKMAGKPVEIWGDGSQTRTFLYIDDAIEKIYEISMANHYHGPVNVSSDEVITVKECADWLCGFADIKPKYKFNLSKPAGVGHRGVDNSKFYKYYKYRNRYTTREGFKKLYEFYKNQVRLNKIA